MWKWRSMKWQCEGRLTDERPVTTAQARSKNYKENHKNVQDFCTRICKRTGDCVCSRICTGEGEWTNSEALLWAPELSQETINFCRWSHHHLTIIDFSAVSMMTMMMRQRRIDNDNNDNDDENAGWAVSTYLDTQTIQAPPAGRSQSWGLWSKKWSHLRYIYIQVK